MTKNSTSVFKTCRQELDAPWEFLNALKKKYADRKILGHFPVYIPFEILESLGAHPVSIVGGGMMDIDRADSLMQSFVCSISKSTLELGLNGTFNSLDGMIFPSICDVARNMSGIWKRNFPDKFTGYIHFPQRVREEDGIEYLESEYRRLISDLEKFTGKKYSDDALAERIAARNKVRRLLMEIWEMKEAEPWKISLSDLYLLTRMGQFVSPEDYEPMLVRAKEEIAASKAKPRDNIRVILEGAFCEAPPLELLDVMEEAGAYFVDNDMLLGTRWFADDIVVNGSPLRALAENYIHKSIPTTARYDGARNRGDFLVERVRKMNANGVVFASAKFCDPAQYDYVRMKNSLEKEHIPFLMFEFEEKMKAFETIQMQIETFVESILFFE